MVTLNESKVSFVTCRSTAASETAGANILDASGEIKVIELISARSPHFREFAKFRGWAGSSCPSHPTMPCSRSVTGWRSPRLSAESSVSSSSLSVGVVVPVSSAVAVVLSAPFSELGSAGSMGPESVCSSADVRLPSRSCIVPLLQKQLTELKSLRKCYP